MTVRQCCTLGWDNIFLAVQIFGTELSPVGENIYPDVDYWRIFLSQEWEKRIQFFYKFWEIRSGTGDLKHFVSLSALFALFTYMANHNFNIADFIDWNCNFMGLLHHPFWL